MILVNWTLKGSTHYIVAAETIQVVITIIQTALVSYVLIFVSFETLINVT